MKYLLLPPERDSTALTKLEKNVQQYNSQAFKSCYCGQFALPFPMQEDLKLFKAPMCASVYGLWYEMPP